MRIQLIILVHASTSTSALKIWYQHQFRCSFILLGKSAHPFVNNVYKAAQLARDMLAHVYILLIFPLCISTKNLYEKYNIIDTDALPPLQKYSRGNLKIYFADTENCIYISSYKREEILFLFYIRWRIFTACDKNCKKL